MDYRKHIQTLLYNNKTEAAKELCNTLALENPGSPEPWFLLAGIYAHHGDYLQVIDNCRKAVSIDPDFFDAHYNLGIALQAKKRYSDAVDAFSKASVLQRSNAGLHAKIGYCLLQLGLVNEALLEYKSAIKLEPDSLELLLPLGTVQIIAHQPTEAIKTLKRLLSLYPDDTDALLQLGIAYRESGHMRKSIKTLSMANKYENAKPELHYQLGITLNNYGNTEKATEAFQQSISIDSSYLPAIYSLAVMRADSGRHDEAMALFNRIIEIDPNNQDAIAGIATVMHYMEDNTGAVKLLDKYTKKESINTNIALAYAAASAAHSGTPADAIKVLLRLCESGSDTINNPDVLFSLGKLYDKAGKYDNAFLYFDRANQLLCPTDYSREQTNDYFERLISAYNKNSYKQLPHSKCYSDCPIFIVGMPRSGSSLVEQFLSAHPAVHGAGELNHIQKITSRICKISGLSMPYPECILHIRDDTLNLLSEEYLELTECLADYRDHVTDKMPHNFLALGLIHLLFPNASIIHCQRNPIDTCLSIYFHKFSQNHPYKFNLENLALYYKQYERLMEHWNQLLPSRIHNIKYEKLIENPEKEARRLLEFCGLDWDKRCLDYHAGSRTVTTPSYQQVSKPIYTTSVGRWRNYRKHVGPLMLYFQDNRHAPVHQQPD